MSDAIYTEYLKSFGLTGPEAVIYQVLLQRAEMTGYEISKECGMSRSNVYGSLSGLVEKGAAYLMEGNPAKYLAVDVEVFCGHMLQELGRRADYLQSRAPKRTTAETGFITIRGSRNIRDKLQDMLKACNRRLYILAESGLIREFEMELKTLISEGKKVVLLTEDYCLPGAIVYRTAVEPDQLRLIIDSAFVLTGELRGADTDSCLYSGQYNFVSVMKEALKNRISLIQLNKEDNSL